MTIFATAPSTAQTIVGDFVDRYLIALATRVPRTVVGLLKPPSTF